MKWKTAKSSLLCQPGWLDWIAKKCYFAPIIVIDRDWTTKNAKNKNKKPTPATTNSLKKRKKKKSITLRTDQGQVIDWMEKAHVG